jgi:hypothetical protein
MELDVETERGAEQQRISVAWERTDDAGEEAEAEDADREAGAVCVRTTDGCCTKKRADTDVDVDLDVDLDVAKRKRREEKREEADGEQNKTHTGYRREYAERAGCLICGWCCPAAFEKKQWLVG